MSFSDDAKNKAQDLTGRAKEAAGAATNDDELKAEGQVDQAHAGIKETVVEVADKLKDGVESVKNKLTGH
ncbi:MAG: CsbD family protein [Gordonia sp. (in: high G+C Gram-positive bacteria)]|uniref:CsbD family protein n=1 Tax=Gordonia sp. (in: high G+C Gram-positive bacteria) TaxID=84139 RepID=UPI003C76DC67